MNNSELMIRALGMGLREVEIYSKLLPMNNDFEENMKIGRVGSRLIPTLCELYEKRDILIDKYEKMTKQLDENDNRVKELLLDINEVSRTICTLEGHRLDMDSYFSTKNGYGYECLVCRQIVYDEDICLDDVFIDRDSSYQRRLKKRTI